MPGSWRERLSSRPDPRFAERPSNEALSRALARLDRGIASPCSTLDGPGHFVPGVRCRENRRRNFWDHRAVELRDEHSVAGTMMVTTVRRPTQSTLFSLPSRCPAGFPYIQTMVPHSTIWIFILSVAEPMHDGSTTYASRVTTIRSTACRTDHLHSYYGSCFHRASRVQHLADHVDFGT